MYSLRIFCMPANDALPFPQRKGDRFKRILQQNDVGYAARRLAAGLDGDGQVGPFQGEHIVDAVPPPWPRNAPWSHRLSTSFSF